MIVTSDISEIRKNRNTDPAQSWGLVPTMGALHDGHLALIQAARENNDRVAVSIFVNPTQFAAGEDLSTYPRPLDQDLGLLETAGVDLVFTPTPAEMYPPGFQTQIFLPHLAARLEGASRPTHFAGVAVVVCKLFNIFQPARAYFGQKDAQQTIVLRQMVQDLNFNLDLVVCPTVRAADGLALSSRNQYLSADQRQAAPIIHQSLQNAHRLILAGERDAQTIRQAIRSMISAEPLARIDYVSAAHAETLAELDRLTGKVLLSAAVFFDRTRLIDNELIYLDPE